MDAFLTAIDPYLPAIIGFLGAILGAIAGFISNRRATDKQIAFQQSNFRREVFTRYMAEREALREAVLAVELVKERSERIDEAMLDDPELLHSTLRADTQTELREALRRRSNVQIALLSRKLEALLCISNPEDSPARLALELLWRAPADDMADALGAYQLACRAEVELDKKKREAFRSQALDRLSKFSPDMLGLHEPGAASSTTGPADDASRQDG